MTITELREIALAHGLGHARFCIEQEATQVGSEELEPLFTAIDNWETAAFMHGSEEFPF